MSDIQSNLLLKFFTTTEKKSIIKKPQSSLWKGQWREYRVKALDIARDWVGITNNFRVGIADIKSREYQRGTAHLVVGSLTMLISATAVIFVANEIFYLLDQVTNYFTYGRMRSKIPEVSDKQIQSALYHSSKGPYDVTLITAYDEGIKEYAQYIIPNQRDFATKHGYNYIEYYGNLAHDYGVPRAPYWSKIAAINDGLKKTQDGAWIAWLDASAIFTNTDKNFDDIIKTYGVGKDIIVTTDPQVPINNAVFLVKNTDWTKNWIQQVWNRIELAQAGKGDCLRPCHYEQQAMTDLIEKNPIVQAHTAIIPNNVMNSFYRYSHYDSFRSMDLDYDSDSEASKWQAGDFICKVTGMDKERRLKMIQYVVENCIDKFCLRKIFHPDSKGILVEKLG